MSPGDPARATLDAEVLRWMREPAWRDDEARFDALARKLFAFQFEHCAPYRRYCLAKGVSPDALTSWRDVPAVPAGAFKEVALRCFPEEQERATFRTSGTSVARRGELHLDTLELYEASLLPTLRRLLFPDLAPDARTTVLVLAPPASALPDSSLSYMFQCLLAALGDDHSGFFVQDGALRTDELLQALADGERRGLPVAVCGTAFAFVHLLEHLEAKDRRVALPRASRVMETGGFKGRGRAVPRETLHARIAACLGVPRERIVNQYGMTELGSQFYDSVLAFPEQPRRKLGPPWARVRLIDPETGREAPRGAPGIVTIHDLANTGNVAAVMTADLGIRVEAGQAPAGFDVLGREPGAEERGCSIAADVMLAGPA